MKIETMFTTLRREQQLIDHMSCNVRPQKSAQMTVILEIPLNVPHIPAVRLHPLAGRRISRSRGIDLVRLYG